MKPPNGLEEIIRDFGDWHSHLRADGSVDAGWEALILGTIALPEPLSLGWVPGQRVHRIRFHYRLCGALQSVFADIHSAGLWGEFKTFDGTYAFRGKRGNPEQPSPHCWAIAIDLNAATNPRGAPPNQHRMIVEMLERVGFEWGGGWIVPDGMHFQFATGY